MSNDSDPSTLTSCSESPPLTSYQHEVLRKQFCVDPEISREKAKLLGEFLKLPYETIETYFKNRRNDLMPKYKDIGSLQLYRKQVLDGRFKLDPDITLVECDILGESIGIKGESVQNSFSKRRNGMRTTSDKVTSPDILTLLADVKQKMKDLDQISLSTDQERTLQLQFQSDPSLTKMLALGNTLNLPEEKVKFWVLSRERKDRWTNRKYPGGRITDSQRNALEEHFLAGKKFTRAERTKWSKEIGFPEPKIYWWHYRRSKKPAERPSDAARRASEESAESSPIAGSYELTPTSSLYNPVSLELKRWMDGNVFNSESGRKSPAAPAPPNFGSSNAPDNSFPPPYNQSFSGFVSSLPRSSLWTPDPLSDADQFLSEPKTDTLTEGLFPSSHHQYCYSSQTPNFL